MQESTATDIKTRESVLKAIKSRESILKAIQEFDEIGRSQFLSKHGFGKSHAYYLSYKGKLYDSKAIMGVAYGYEHPKLNPLTGRDFSGGEHTVQKHLERLGFQLVINNTHRVSKEDELEDWAKGEEEEGAFDPDNDKDARDRAFRAIVQRRGQPAFRKKLIKAYEGKCAITGCNLLEVLEAAHIRPYQGEHTNHPSNGILLRADLHTLFDLHLITLDDTTLNVLIAPELKGTEYEGFAGRRIFIPAHGEAQPNRKAVKLHREEANL